MKSIHELNESFRIALSALRANKSRGILTTLGIVIGIMAVVTTMTAANGLGNRFKESISAIGSDVLYVSRMPWVMTGNFFEYRNRDNLEMAHAVKLERTLKKAVAINPTTNTARRVKYQSNILEDITVIGTTDKHTVVSNSLPESGRFLTPFDIQNKKKVCVIGSDIKERLFEGADPVNKKMKIGRYSYLVVGVMEKQGSAGFFGGPNFDTQIFVPISAFAKSFGSRNRNFNIAVKAPSNERLSDFEYELVGEMRKIRRLRPTEQDDFSVNQMTTLVSAYDRVMGVVVLIGLIITGISLFVGGIGVMNIMFVSVTERTKEIGTRKAIGAKKRAILAQFLFESAVICLLGGFLGVILAVGTTAVIDKLLMPASISIPIAVIALMISAIVGIFSGFIPAFKAARLNPIDALRYE